MSWGRIGSIEGLAMRKLFLSAAVLTVAGLMFNDAFACELNREAKAISAVLPGACIGSDCLVNAAQDDPQDCATGYYDPGTYTGSNGLLDWLVASLDVQSQYKPAAGFAPSPMDANAQYR
jgi:hypothetical protein